MPHSHMYPFAQCADDGSDVTIYEWTGANSYVMMGQKDSIALGGGKYVTVPIPLPCPST